MSKPKIMFFDCETSFNTVRTFYIGSKVSISHDQIIDERKVVCICWMMEGEKKVHHLQWDAKKHCDKKMMEKFIKIISEVDVAIAHNGDKYDIPVLKTRGIYHKLPPMTNIQTIDTLKLARNNFRFNSNRLDYIAKYLGFKGKKATGGLQLWHDVQDRCPNALKKMVDYCKQDVTELREIFWKLVPYCDRLPVHLGILLGGDRPCCKVCGDKHPHKINVHTTASGVKYQRYRCKTCKHVFRDNKRLTT
jgi:DNA polymerase elongation subunit (family B)